MQSAQPKVLEQAFAAFNQQSAQLETAYQALKQQVHDLSEQLAAARSERVRQLKEKERLASRLARLLEALPGGVVVLNGEGKIVDHNPAALEILGGPLTTRSWQDVLSRLRSVGSSEFDSANGRRISVSRRPLVAEPGHILLLTDVTEQHALQTMLSRRERLAAMGEMSARLAHQIRTPLSAIFLYSSHLERQAVSDVQRQRFAGKIGGRVTQLEQMVDDLLRFTRGDEGHHNERLSAASLLSEVEQMLEPQLNQGQRIHVDLLDEPAPFSGNREALVGALCNLGTNALQAGSSVVRYSVQQPDSAAIEIRVEDNGSGIPADQLSCVFEPFYTTRPSGTGLGLAVVKSTVDAHAGSIEVDSHVDNGTRFRILLNRHADEALPSDAGRAASRCPSLVDRLVAACQ
ncbi:MAG: ATP-binding protein [Pseudomonadota bacterium]